jgi:hypothetical protein
LRIAAPTVAVFVICAVRAQFGDLEQYFAQAVMGPGYKTIVTVHNPSDTPIVVRLLVRTSEGVDAVNRDLNLNARASERVELPGGARLAVGWVKLSSSSRFTATEAFEVTVGQFDRIGVLPVQLTRNLQIFASVRTGQGLNTGFATANPSPTESADLTVRLFDKTGQMVGERKTQLGPGGHLARFLTESPYFTDLTDFEGIMEVISTTSVAAVGLVSQNNELTTVAVVAPGLPIRAEYPAESPNLIAGHASNSVKAGIHGAVIGGGGNADDPNLVEGNYGTVSGGVRNKASGTDSTVGGGIGNFAKGWCATVAGGSRNTANWTDSTVGGGYYNYASGVASTIPGGRSNSARGDFSLAAGRDAKALHNGAFVWADSTEQDFESTAVNQFLIRAAGGVGIGMNSPQHPLHMASGAHVTAGGTWSNGSDRNSKENFASLDRRILLEKLATLPIASWNYRAEDKSIRHIGPTAQDFRAAFGLGGDERAISTVDADGVALAAIQELYRMVREKDAEIEAVRREVVQLRASGQQK